MDSTEPATANRRRPRRKGERTRARLLDAARRVFEERGFLDARITDIASEAGAAVGSFYTYFDSKQAIFLELVHDFYVDLNPVSLDGSIGDGPIEQIDRTNRAYVDFYRRNLEMIKLIESTSSFIPEVRDLRLKKRRLSVEVNVRAIERLQDDGLVPKELDPFVTANALLAMVSGFTYSWLVLGEDFDSETAARHMTTLWVRSLGLDHTLDASASWLMGGMGATVATATVTELRGRAG